MWCSIVTHSLAHSKALTAVVGLCQWWLQCLSSESNTSDGWAAIFEEWIPFMSTILTPRLLQTGTHTHTHARAQNKVELVLLPRCIFVHICTYVHMYCVYTVRTLAPYLWHLYIKSSPGLHQGASISMYIRTCCFVTWSVCVCCKVFSSCTNHLCCHYKRTYVHT